MARGASEYLGGRTDGQTDEQVGERTKGFMDGHFCASGGYACERALFRVREGRVAWNV